MVAETDILVAGAGIAGCTAAVTAARNNAKVMLIDRFGTLGGNMGPGGFAGGVVHLALCQPHVMHEGLKGIPGEFLTRCAAYVGGQLGHQKPWDAQVVSYVWLKLMEVNNVDLLLNSVVDAPTMEGRRVTGLAILNKSGTLAVNARVVIDATGEADVAGAAGAPVEDKDARFHASMYFAIAGVDEARFGAFLNENATPDPDDVEWGRDIFQRMGVGMFSSSWYPLLRLLRRAWNHGKYRIIKRIRDIASVTMDHGLNLGIHQTDPDSREGILSSMVGLWGKDVDWTNAAVHSQLGVGARTYIFESAQFFRHHVPAFRNSYLSMISPYFHNRFGRSAITDYVLRTSDITSGAQFDDVVFRAWPTGHPKKFADEGFDFPYRQFLPRNVDGLLMAGRSALSGETVNRSRYKVMLMGQVAGLAAALAAKYKTSPRQINVTLLQRLLYHKYHVPMEDNPARLRKLGILP